MGRENSLVSSAPNVTAVRAYLLDLQDRICAGLEAEDGSGKFREDNWTRAEGGGGRTRIMAEGGVFEKAGVAFSHVRGLTLPPSATAHRPALAGRPWEALGVSLVIHPRNPCVPTSHANVRFFCAAGSDGISNLKSAISDPIWWFGGGFDLTPYYGFEEDARHWHQTARAAVAPFGPDLYPTLKRTCDEYFFLKHRDETRGVGGIFYDYQDPRGVLYKGQDPDGPAAAVSNQLGPVPQSWEQLFALASACGNAFLPSYLPIAEKRQHTPYGERERQFQLYRRGRYVEFNLVFDRGTIFGLQTNGRTESILMSLPPLVRWEYGYQPEAGSREALLTDLFTRPQDWLEDGSLADRCAPHQALN